MQLNTRKYEQLFVDLYFLPQQQLFCVQQSFSTLVIVCLNLVVYLILCLFVAYVYVLITLYFADEIIQIIFIHRTRRFVGTDICRFLTITFSVTCKTLFILQR